MENINKQQLYRKWKPILEHKDLAPIKDMTRKEVTAVLLENQEKAMREQQNQSGGLFLSETSNLSGMEPGGLPSNGGATHFVDPVLISLVRRTMPNIAAYDLCGVQPMTGPTGLIFAFRSFYGKPEVQTNSPQSYSRESGFDEANTMFASQTSANTVDPLDFLGGWNNSSSPYDLRGDRIGIGADTGIAEKWGTGGVEIPEMSFGIERISVTAKTRKLKGEFTQELAQDLKNTHGLDAESELANIISSEITAEINREIFRTIYYIAKKGAQNTTSTGIFDCDVDSNGRWSVERWKGCMFQIEREANAIATSTRMGKGNIILTSSDVASALQMAGVLDYSPALQNNLQVDTTSGNIFAGILNGRYKVYIDPYYEPINDLHMAVVGFKGESYSAGLFFSPYIPLIMSRAVGENTFQPKIGFSTRYGMAVNPLSRGVDSISRDGDGFERPHQNTFYRKFAIKNLM